MCFDDLPERSEDDNRLLTDPASAPGVRVYSDYLRKLKPAIALAAGRKAQSEYNRKHYLKNRNKAMSRSIFRRAIERGDLVRPSQCEQCGGNAGGVEGHHCDYNKPLDVLWLCRLCHRKWHAANGSGLNG